MYFDIGIAKKLTTNVEIQEQTSSLHEPWDYTFFDKQVHKQNKKIKIWPNFQKEGYRSFYLIYFSNQMDLN